MTMRGQNRLVLIAAAALLATALPSEWADAQRRERGADAPPPGPVPRTADGKVMLTGGARGRDRRVGADVRDFRPDRAGR